MGGQSGLSELSVISWVSAFERCPLSGVPLNTLAALVEGISSIQPFSGGMTSQLSLTYAIYSDIHIFPNHT